MDRNGDPCYYQYRRRGVALRKESVDRNCAGFVAGSKHIVALRKESVDRNCYLGYDVPD